MQTLSAAANEAVARIAERNGFSVQATQSMLDAVVRGGGSMAQFSHPEFSGSGQWMRGGMTMVSDMFNNDLKAWVGALCTDLSNLIGERPELLWPVSVSRSPMPEPPAVAASPHTHGWPAELGVPSSSGSQNGSRYAVFLATRRLAIEQAGHLTVYDTLDHRIGGVSQQQGSGASLRFTSQSGPVDLATLPIVSGWRGDAPAMSPDAPASTPRQDDIPATLERLADLRGKGILSAEEFSAKKAELLARI